MANRKRIKSKVSINEVIKTLDNKKRVYSESIKYIMQKSGINYIEAKKELNKQMKFKTFQRELNNL